MSVLRFMKLFIKKLLIKARNRTSSISSPGNIALTAKISGSKLYPNARVAKGAEVRNSIINDYSSIGRDSKISSAIIGKFSSISWNVTINARNHKLSTISTHAFPFASRIGYCEKDDLDFETVKIGNDVWVGAGAIILPGIEVGDGAVIGAGAVVTKNVKPYSIVAGNPAKQLRKRFSDEDIHKLLELSWWDFDNKKIVNNIDLFRVDNDIKKVIELLDN